MERPPLPAGSNEPEPDPKIPEDIPRDMPNYLQPIPGKVLKHHRRPPQGAMTQKQKEVTPSEQAAFAVMEVELGGRQRIIQVLQAVSLPKNLEIFANLLADPLHDHEPLARVAALAGVTQAKLSATFEAAITARGKLLATINVATRLPEVTSAVMEDAIPGLRACSQCLGAGEVSKPSSPDEQMQCPSCKGSGRTIFVPDHDTQKTALKLGKMLDSGKGGTQINMHQNNLVHAAGDSAGFDRLMTTLDDVLYGKGRERLGKQNRDTVDADFHEVGGDE